VHAVLRPHLVYNEPGGDGGNESEEVASKPKVPGVITVQLMVGKLYANLHNAAWLLTHNSDSTGGTDICTPEPPPA
jgi:hypothetical protein